MMTNGPRITTGTTPVRPRATPTRTTLVRSAPMMTNGPRITTGTTPVTPMLTATPPPGGARTARVAPAATTAPVARRPSTTGPPLAMATSTGASPPPTGMPGAEIRTTPRMSLTTRPSPSLMPPSLTMSGTTLMTTSGAPRLGARTVTSTVLPPTVRPLPAPTTTSTPPRVVLLPPDGRVATSSDTAANPMPLPVRVLRATVP